MIVPDDTPDEMRQWQEGVDEAVRLISSAMDAEIEERLKAANLLGLDLAVSEPEMDGGSLKRWFVPLTRGWPPPVDGRRWTVYRSGEEEIGG